MPYEDLFDASAHFDNYFLKVLEPGGTEVRPEEWDSLGVPAQGGNLEHVFLERGMEAGFGEVVSWTSRPEWLEADLVAARLFRGMPGLLF